MLQECFKDVARVFQGYIQRVLRMCQWSLKTNFLVFKRCFKRYWECFKVVLFLKVYGSCHSSQLPEQKEGLFVFVVVDVVVAIFVNIIILALSHYIQLGSINVYLGVLEATIVVTFVIVYVFLYCYLYVFQKRGAATVGFLK